MGKRLAPLSLKLCTEQQCMVNFTPQMLHPHEGMSVPMAGCQYPWHKGLGGSQSQDRRFWRCENILTLPGLEPRICTARSLVTVMNMLCRHPADSYKT